MTNTMTALRVEAGGASATLLSSQPTVTDYAGRYFGPWWHALDVPVTSVCAGPLVAAEVDAASYERLEEEVSAAEHDVTSYAKAKLLVAREKGSGAILGVSPGEGLAYRSEPETGHVTVYGCQEVPVALASARILRELVRGQLLRDGWTLVHASAVVREDGGCVLTFGDKGAGKTTTALLTVSRGGALLANDRVFMRLGEDGGLTVLPWPSAAAIGLGLLDALGWGDVCRERLQAGEQLHPTQHQAVTDAILAGNWTPIWEPGGRRERKAQVYPDQFLSWFGFPLAPVGRAALVLFPRVEAGAVPAVEDGGRELGPDDFMSGATEDRYPDVFHLAQGIDGGGAETARATVAAALSALPAHRLVLGHDVQANADLLEKVTGL
jgi:hypothetical protein